MAGHGSGSINTKLDKLRSAGEHQEYVCKMLSNTLEDLQKAKEQGYPYRNWLSIFMTQARAPTPHEVAAKSAVTDHLPGAVREKYSAQQARQHGLLLSLIHI